MICPGGAAGASCPGWWASLPMRDSHRALTQTSLYGHTAPRRALSPPTPLCFRSNTVLPHCLKRWHAGQYGSIKWFFGCEWTNLSLFGFPEEESTRQELIEFLFLGQQKTETSVCICSRDFMEDWFINMSTVVKLILGGIFQWFIYNILVALSANIAKMLSENNF